MNQGKRKAAKKLVIMKWRRIVLVIRKLKSYKVVILALEDVTLFMPHKDNTDKAKSISSTVDAICKCGNTSTVQTTLDSFLVTTPSLVTILLYIVLLY